ncbi:MAG TPA: polyamine aminopropyltransferase [Cyclobacteriaceae bacterium]
MQVNKSFFLKLSLFATGFSGIVAEYTLSTNATYFLGDSVIQWTLIVSLMLFAMGLGSRLSKNIEGDLLRSFIIIEFILSVIVSSVTNLIYASSIIYGYNGITIYGTSIIIGLLIGMEIPLVVRLNNVYQSLKVNISSALENDYYGSLLGGVFFAFLGLPYVGLTYIPIILGSLNFFVALVLLIMLWVEVPLRNRNQFKIMASLVLILLLTNLIISKPLIDFGEQLKYKDRVIFSEQTRYQKIVITQSAEDFWLFINGNQQLSTLDEYLYHEPLVHVAMCLAGNHDNILILGGGDGAAAREVLKYNEVKSITVVDLDPKMTQLGQSYPMLLEMNHNALNHDKVTIINQDGFKYLESVRELFDVIIVDLPDPKTVDINRLYTFEFYLLCKQALNEGGVMITQAGSPYFAAKAFKCIELTVEKAGFSTLPLHNHLITLGEWGWVLGKKSDQKTDEMKYLLRNIQLNDLSTRWLTKESVDYMINFGNRDYFLNGDNIEVNKLYNPVLYRYYDQGDWAYY